MTSISTSLDMRPYVEELSAMIERSGYPCIGAKAVAAKHQLHCFVAGDITRCDDDERIISFLYEFVSNFKRHESTLCSAAVIFEAPSDFNEQDFDRHLWARLQALADLDACNYVYDLKVSSDPTASNFGFSLMSEALYVIGLHPNSARPARRFSHAAMVFNPHAQFEWLRGRGKYDSMKRAIRQRDSAYSGSVNPMLLDFGVASEAIQYSGIQDGNNWKCPFVSRH